MPGSISNVSPQDLAYVHATSSAGSSVTGMDVNPDPSRHLNSIYLDEKIEEYYTPAVSHYQQEFFLPASSSVTNMGIAITTNTAQLLTPFSSTTSPISPSHYCPFPLPSRSTSLRATTSVMVTSPPPVPPKDIKNSHIYPFSSIPPPEKKSSSPTSPVFEERYKKGAPRKTRSLRKSLRGIINGRIRQDFHIRKSILARISEGTCAVM